MADDFIKTSYTLERHHFAYFVGCCRSLVKLMGLLDWELSYQFLGSDAETPRASATVHDAGNRLASIQLYDEWDTDPNEWRLWRTAFHEVVELLLSNMHMMATSRAFDYLSYDREHHRVIRTLENSWFTEIWNNGHDVFNFQSDAEGRCCARPELPELDNKAQVPDPGVQRNKRSKK